MKAFLSTTVSTKTIIDDLEPLDETVSIVVPAFNEAERLSSGLEIILNYLEQQDFRSELIVVDDGSADETAEIAESSFAKFAGDIPARVIKYEQNRGKGYAVRTGILAATGDIALFSDADLSTPIFELEKLINPIKNGTADLTFGSRALDRSLIGTHQPWRREQGGKAFNFIVRMLTNLPFWDTQCGFKAFRTRALRPVFEAARIDRFGFDVELLFVAYRAGLRLNEIPVRWNHCEGSKVSVFRDSRRMFGEVREIRRNFRRGLYDKAIADVNALNQAKAVSL